MSVRRGVVVGAVLAVAGFSEVAHASNEGNTELALDLHYVAPVSPDLDITGGAGVALRAGRRWYPGDWVMTGELMGTYDSFGGTTEARLYGLLAGLRLAYDGVLRPGLFVHGGVARASFDDIAAPGLGHTAFTYDVGAFLDLTLLPLLDVGAHASFNHSLESNDGSDAVKWLNVGLHGELIFDFL